MCSYVAMCLKKNYCSCLTKVEVSTVKTSICGIFVQTPQ